MEVITNAWREFLLRKFIIAYYSRFLWSKYLIKSIMLDLEWSHRKNLLWFLFHSTSCNKDYLPPNCVIRKCQGRNDNFGHYTCLNETTKQCLQGWLDTSTNCTKREYTKYTLIVFKFVWWTQIVGNFVIVGGSKILHTH